LSRQGAKNTKFFDAIRLSGTSPGRRFVYDTYLPVFLRDLASWRKQLPNLGSRAADVDDRSRRKRCDQVVAGRARLPTDVGVANAGGNDHALAVVGQGWLRDKTAHAQDSGKRVGVWHVEGRGWGPSLAATVVGPEPALTLPLTGLFAGRSLWLLGFGAGAETPIEIDATWVRVVLEFFGGVGEFTLLELLEQRAAPEISGADVVGERDQRIELVLVERDSLYDPFDFACEQSRHHRGKVTKFGA